MLLNPVVSALASIVLLPGLALAQSAPSSAPATAGAEQEVRAARREFVEAARARNREVLERLLADEFTFVHGTGVPETRQQYIDANVAGAQLAQRAEFETLEEQIRVYDDRFAVWTSKAVARTRAGETNLRALNVFVKRDGRWQWLAAQSTRLPNRPPAATVEPAALDACLGTYAVGEGRVLTVKKDGLVLKAMLPGFREAELVPRSSTDFVWFNPDLNVYAELRFVKDASGRATEAVYVREGQEAWRAPRK